MAYKKIDNITISGAKIKFRNFEGRETQYTPEGVRTFCVIIDSEATAKKLVEDGWNVKSSAPYREGDEPEYYIQVRCSFEHVPPVVYLINGNAKVKLEEENIGKLDHVDIENIDLVIRPYYWEAMGKSGFKAYLKSMYVTLERDAFADKYADKECGGDDVPW